MTHHRYVHHHYHHRTSIWWTLIVALWLFTYWTTILTLGLVYLAVRWAYEAWQARQLRSRGRERAYWEFLADQSAQRTGAMTTEDREFLYRHGWNGR